MFSNEVISKGLVVTGCVFAVGIAIANAIGEPLMELLQVAILSAL